MAASAAGISKRLVPLLDRILIKKVEPVKKSAGGILIPEKAQKSVVEGTVVAAGNGTRNKDGEVVPVTLKPGDMVLLPEHGGTKIQLGENEEYHLFRESDVLAKLS